MASILCDFIMYYLSFAPTKLEEERRKAQQEEEREQLKRQRMMEKARIEGRGAEAC